MLDDMDGRIDALLDGGDCQVGVESTIIDLTCTPPRLLRPGGIPLEQLKDVLESVEFLDEDGKEHTFTVQQLELGYRHSYFTGKRCVILSARFRLQRDPDGPEAVKARMEEIYDRRKEKQPLEWPSAGSTFKRPEGAYAAALIDQCGLKGFRVGGAQVSEKHAGFVINVREATCADVLDLIQEVRRVVKEKTGYTLEPEVRVTGGNS